MSENDEVRQFLQEIKEEHGEIIAHPLMFVSALHNRQGCFPVKQDDEFFRRNDIKFLSLPDTSEIPETPPAMKYLVQLDESGAYRHTVVANS